MFHYKDQIQLTLISGAGGLGSCSFHRTRKIPRGGPDGGDGGKGGDVILRASTQVKNFNHFAKKRIWRASRGCSGENQLKQGARGKDITLDLPPGTVVKDLNGKLLVNFKEDSSVIFLKGGQGGRGNAFFKNSLNQAPRHFQKGLPGLEKKVILELKPHIQIGLIGRANTGKSSFFNSITGAKSPIGAYPYTTLQPYYGQIKHVGFPCKIMDIPGLSQGASKNITKGLAFLRLLQRTELLVHFVDGTSSIKEDIIEIERELKLFDQACSYKEFSPLSKKKQLVVLTKIDLLEDASRLEDIKKIGKNYICLSNKTKQGCEELLVAINKEISN